jgi:hypothetical protein
MELEGVFEMVSLLAFISWVLLFLFYPKQWVYTTLFSGVMVILAFTYLFFIVQGLTGPQEGGFDSLSGVRNLFSSDEALLAGWIHYLAFDLFVGMWISKDAWERHISRWLVFPCLILTFMLGPVGWLVYFTLRVFNSGKLQQSPFQR